MLKKKELWLILFIFIFGIFLRFYRLGPNLIFNGEMGTDYMNVWHILHGERSWFIGPRTSHEWFFIPPISYWIYAIVLFLFNFNPISINIFWAFVGSLTIFVCWYYVRRLFNNNAALIASFLVAFSPAWIAMTRDARYNAPAAIMFFPYIYYLKSSIENKGKSLLMLGIILGLSLNFFPTALLLIPSGIVSFAFFRVVPNLKEIKKFILGFLAPNITYFIYDATHGFEIIKQILLWVPYRILGFFGLYEKNRVNSEVLGQNFYSIYQFFYEQFTGRTNILSALIFGLFLVGIFYSSQKLLRNKKKDISLVVLLITFLVSYIGLFIHGNPPKHYYLVIFPIPIILVSYFLDKFIQSNILKTATILSFGIASLIYLSSVRWFSPNVLPPNYDYYVVAYSLQKEVTKKVEDDSMHKTFSIKRIGINDQFDNDFANNYVYLLTVDGYKVVNDSSLVYTIVENDYVVNGLKIFDKQNLRIYKNEK